LALSDLFWELMDDRCAGFGFKCVSPLERRLRGSQLAFAHANAYEIMQALIDRGVIGDYRQPDLLRFGFTPLYTRFEDVWLAVDQLHVVMKSGAWQDAKYRQRNTVT
jgi:kynureninase